MKKGVKAITGKKEIVAGQWQNYTVSEWYPDTPIEERSEAFVTWHIYALNQNEPTLALEKKQGRFRFGENGVGLNFLISAFSHEPELDNASAMTITVVSSQKPDILNIKLSDSNSKPISGPIATGETVNAHVETVGMVGHKVAISLWRKHDDQFENLQEQFIVVGSKGVAFAQFIIPFNSDKKRQAMQGGSSTDTYYVSAYAQGEMTTSAALKMKAEGKKQPTPNERKKETADNMRGQTPKKDPIEPVKKKIPVQQTDIKPPKKYSPGIRGVYITDINNQLIKGSFTGKVLRVWIISQGLQNKDIRFKIYEQDLTENQLILNQEFTLDKDKYPIDVTLKKIPKSKGDDLFEGSTQELFVDIEILETHSHIKSAVVDVDVNTFTVNKPTNVSKAMVEQPDSPKKGEAKSCVCKQYDLIWGDKVSCDFRKKVVEIAKNIGLPQEKNEGANWLMAVMALETGRTFSPTCGTFKKHKDDNRIGYVGLIQFGKDAAKDIGIKRSELIKKTALEQLTYVEKFFKLKRFEGKLTTKTDLYLAVNYPAACGKGIDKDHIVYDSTKSAYDDNPSFKREENEYYFDKKGVKQYYKGKKGSTRVWEVEEALNELYNEGKNHKIEFFGTCPIILKTITEKDIVTFKIYNDGKIEKKIPKQIKEGYEKKFKYVYYDKKKNEHAICILDWHKTKEKETGTRHNSIPKHEKILTDENVSEGSTTRRVKYVNGDIAEYGKHPTLGKIWRLYKAKENEIELIKMPDSINYSKDDIIIKFSFSSTKRRFTGPGVFAAFIGALAECSNSSGIITTGSCFKEGSCFPSAEHVNGRSVDTLYYKTLKLDQAFIDAVVKFNFTEVLVGENKYCKQLNNAQDGGVLHNTHLHSGNFDNQTIKEIKE